MKKTLLAIALTLALVSCKKDNPNETNCYECDLGSGYQDSGCYTNSEWDGIEFTDFNGTPIDKSSQCRKK